MDVKLTQRDLDYFKRDEATNPVIRYLKNKDNIKFNIGDVLIRQHARRDNMGPHGVTIKWVTDNVSSVSNAPKKFVYVHENEHGVGYIKQLRADGGGFTNYTACTANIDFDHTRYSLDPDYADHLLLADGESKFVYQDRFKEDKIRRQSTYKYNKTLIEDTNSPEKVNTILDALKVGDLIWIGRGIYRAVEQEFTVIGVKPDPYSSNYNKGYTIKQLEVRTKGGGTHRFSTETLQRCTVLLKPPRPFEKP